MKFSVEAWLKAKFENEDSKNSDATQNENEKYTDKVNNFFGNILSNFCTGISNEQLNNFYILIVYNSN
jgi:hypothetical protein